MSVTAGKLFASNENRGSATRARCEKSWIAGSSKSDGKR